MNRRDELAHILAGANVNPDAFEDWLEHPVTKRFRQEIELMMLDEQADNSPSYQPTCESIALATVRSRTLCESLDDVLKWKPQELKVD